MGRHAVVHPQHGMSAAAQRISSVVRFNWGMHAIMLWPTSITVCLQNSSRCTLWCCTQWTVQQCAVVA
jgi:hypothetical protein